MSRSGKNIVVAFAALLLALPLAARSHAPKGSKSTVRASVELTQDATLAGKQLKAGTYQVRANESTLTLLQKGKVVAETPIEWKPEGKGSSSSEVMIDSGSVKEIHFMGKDRYAQITSQSDTQAEGQK
jgi:hypothetical protein